ncbi:hypothetical protein VP01_496g10 [Puccinia sorghi]|uniref:Uncharacterized protein n=1 Tax=Puccinia sorghi TaxID=27349 RepID=A0A0L6ULW5_9BASI|nr:hypothetical protein VP01_496g10 [Puccinia sorghi]
MSDTKMSDTQAILFEKKRTRNFFGRLSNHFSSHKQQATTPSPTSSTPPPQISLSKTLSNDPLIVPSPSSLPTHHLSQQNLVNILSEPSLSCHHTDLLYRPKDLKNRRCPSTHTERSSKSKSTSTRASNFFRKRLSLSTSVLADDEEPMDGAMTPEILNRSPVGESTPTSLSSDGHPSSIMSSELSSANHTAETSLASTDEAETEECGLAGIGVRNRMSVCLHSLPIDPRVAPQLAGLKPPVHPAMRYAPSSSSPLSSGRLAEPPADNLFMPTSSKRFSSQSHAPCSHSSLPSRNHKHMSFGHLGLVPNQSAVDSQTLMRLLRGPSSYPEELSLTVSLC